MLDDLNLGVNDPEPADPVLDNQPQDPQPLDNDPVDPGVNDPEPADPEPVKPVQDPETNAMFAEIRRRAEQSAKDNTIRELSNGQFNTYTEYQEAMQRQQWEEQGKDPELEMLKTEVMGWKREKTLMEQKESLKDEPFFKDWLPEMEQLVQSDPNYDYDVAYTVLARQKLRDVMTQAAKQGEQKTLQNVIDRNKKQVEPTADAGHVSKIDVNALNDKDMDDLVQRAMRGERIVL